MIAVWGQGTNGGSTQRWCEVHHRRELSCPLWAATSDPLWQLELGALRPVLFPVVTRCSQTFQSWRCWHVVPGDSWFCGLSVPCRGMGRIPASTHWKPGAPPSFLQSWHRVIAIHCQVSSGGQSHWEPLLSRFETGSTWLPWEFTLFVTPQALEPRIWSCWTPGYNLQVFLLQQGASSLNLTSSHSWKKSHKQWRQTATQWYVQVSGGSLWR